MKQLEINSGKFTLERLPKTTKGDLRAWDAADELILNTVFEDQVIEDYIDKNNLKINNASNPILIVNDSFGALSCSLSDYSRHSWSDSYLSHLAIENNLKRNELNTSNYQAIPSSSNLETIYSLVVIKIPKTLGLLEDQLSRLKAHINEDSTIIASAMSKHIHTSTLKSFEKFIGTTATSRATKKARLIFSTNDNKTKYPSPFPKSFTDKQHDLTLINHANVFAKDKLDIGTRFFINYLSQCPTAKHIVDLGCGNGALGIMMKRIQPQAHISFIDESYGAIISAEENCKNEKLSIVSFHPSDSFNQFAPKTEPEVDLILCNPPFHQNHSIGDHIAWEMLKQSQDILQDNGEIWVIGNRHLGYHVKLSKLFGNCETVASNKKFVILKSKKYA